MLVHWIWLAQRSGVSDRVRMTLLEKFPDAEDVYHAGREELAVEGLTEQGMEALMDKSLDEAHKILAQCAQKGIRVMTMADEAYPSRLRAIPDPPVVLYMKGELPAFGDRPTIGV
ncbi:MAG: DNA-processing protein DprA, partial [Oscillospiraceae bacterium]|nr:DNA-processing protein DprA [Oscillospiraceae bacterium]